MATMSFDQFLKQGGIDPKDPSQLSQVKTLGVNKPAPAQPVPEVKKPGSSIVDAFKGGTSKIKTGFEQAQNAHNPLELIEGGLKQGAGVVEAASAPLTPVFKPVGDLIHKAGEKIADQLGPDIQRGLAETPKTGAERFAEDLADATTIGGAVAGVETAPKGFSFISKKLDEINAPKPKVEGELPVTPTPKVPKIVEQKTPKLLSIFTGENVDAVRSAMEHPDIADLGIKGGDTALRNAVNKGAEASIKARSDFNKAHSEAVKTLIKDNRDIKIQGKKDVLYKFVDDLAKNDVTFKKGKPDFSISKINANPGEVSKINAAYDAIKGWKDWSVDGTIKLKQIIGQYTKFANEAGGTSKSPFLGKFYHYLDQTIKNALPEEARAKFTEMNKKYTDTIDLYDDMVNAFNSGDPFTKLSQIFGANKDTLRQVVDFYEKTTGNKIKPVVAGRLLAEEKPAQFGFLNPRQWIDFFIDPKVQAKIVTKTGRAMKK